MRIRFSLLTIIAAIFVFCVWLAAFSYPNDSTWSGYDLNLEHFPYSEPIVPAEFDSLEPVVVEFVNSGTDVRIAYDNGHDFYQTAYKEGWDSSLDYFLYPSMASWKYSEAYFPWLTTTLPSKFSRDHLAWARRDGFKACSDQIETSLHTDPEFHSKLLTPTYYRGFWPAIVSLAVGLMIAFRWAYCKPSRDNNVMHAKPDLRVPFNK